MRFMAIVLMAFACPAYADVVQLSADTYMATRSSKAGAFTNMAKLKAAVIREANEFAARQGKIAVPIWSCERKRDPFLGFRTSRYQIQNRRQKNDPSASNRALPSQPDVVIGNAGHTSAEVGTTTDRKPDLYTELMKLDDLRKRGLLTDAEFEQQKKKLLDSSQ